MAGWEFYSGWIPLLFGIHFVRKKKEKENRKNKFENFHPRNNLANHGSLYSFSAKVGIDKAHA